MILIRFRMTCSKGVEIKLVRGGKNYLACALSCARKFPPPQAIFPPPGHDFSFPLAILFQFFLFISLGWSSLQEGGLSPLRSSARGTSPPSSTHITCRRGSCKIPCYYWKEKNSHRKQNSYSVHQIFVIWGLILEFGRIYEDIKIPEER